MKVCLLTKNIQLIYIVITNVFSYSLWVFFLYLMLIYLVLKCFTFAEYDQIIFIPFSPSGENRMEVLSIYSTMILLIF